MLQTWNKKFFSASCTLCYIDFHKPFIEFQSCEYSLKGVYKNFKDIWREESLLEERPNYCVCTTFPALCQYSDKSYLKIIFRRDFLCHNRNSFIFELVRETPPDFFGKTGNSPTQILDTPFFSYPQILFVKFIIRFEKNQWKLFWGNPIFFKGNVLLFQSVNTIYLSGVRIFEWVLK